MSENLTRRIDLSDSLTHAQFMDTERDTALQNLRAWSATDRAALLAAAWRAGEHSVPVLADAARCSRQTAYVDLHSCGIDAKNDRPQEVPAMFATVTLEGLDGTDADTADLSITQMHRDFAAAHPELTGEALTRASMGAMFRFSALHALTRWHNQYAAALNAQAAARTARDNALHQEEVRWESLSVARSWAAAHHAWLQAAHNARTAIIDWAEAAHRAAPEQHRLSTGYLDEAREYGAPCDDAIPADLRIVAPAPIDVDAQEARLLQELDTKVAARRELAAQTLNALRNADAL
jgi:hypothetical protein